jgi:hypothetical protein
LEADGRSVAPVISRIRWALLALAAAQRIVYVGESEALPFLDAPLFDSAVYQHQAEAILAGRFDDPTLVAFGPLYGWFLAAFGLTALYAQLALGLGTALLVERIAARHSAIAGVVALGLWIGYAVPLFYEAKVMSETLGLFLTVAAVAVYTGPRFERAEPLAGVGAGALLGLATLTRANLLFSLPFFALFALAPRGDEGRRPRVARAGALTLGIALVLAANGSWNLAHFGRFIPVILTSRTASTASAEGGWSGSLAVFGTDERPPSAWDVVRQAEATLAAPAAPQAVPRIDLAAARPSSRAPSRTSRRPSTTASTASAPSSSRSPGSPSRCGRSSCSDCSAASRSRGSEVRARSCPTCRSCSASCSSPRSSTRARAIASRCASRSPCSAGTPWSRSPRWRSVARASSSGARRRSSAPGSRCGT